MTIQDLINLQHSFNPPLTDSQFAQRLGYSCRETWNKIKNGKLPLNDKFLMRVYRAFPEANIFLSLDATNISKVATPYPTESPQTPSEPRQRGLFSRLVSNIIKFFFPDRDKPTKSKISKE